MCFEVFLDGRGESFRWGVVADDFSVADFLKDKKQDIFKVS